MAETEGLEEIFGIIFELLDDMPDKADLVETCRGAFQKILLGKVGLGRALGSPLICTGAEKKTKLICTNNIKEFSIEFPGICYSLSAFWYSVSEAG